MLHLNIVYSETTVVCSQYSHTVISVTYLLDTLIMNFTAVEAAAWDFHVATYLHYVCMSVNYCLYSPNTQSTSVMPIPYYT